MRKLLVSVAIATATLAAVPAAAQYQDRHWDDRPGYGHRTNWQAVNDLRRDLAQIEDRINRSARRGQISQREAFGLRREANRIENRLQRASRGGLSGREFAELRVSVNRLRQHLRVERRDFDRRRG
jgi:hypothetical protein